MQYGICNLSIVPLRIDPSDTSELVTQVLYGEFFKVLEQRKSWSRIRLAYDNYEGWIDNKQYVEISKENYTEVTSQDHLLSTDLIEYVQDENDQLYTIPIGSSLNGLDLLNHSFDGNSSAERQDKSKLIKTAFLYLNAPYLWGGKTPFGIDCSGFTQMVYKLNGYHLLRDASQQATQGHALSFIEESEPGDLAFFDNAEGAITHVGIIMEDNYIIHAHGKVRIDRLDHSGIYNTDKRLHTHKLRVIKKII
ncbi:C40 family peptidase [Psychroserpens sp.]|uniref:C40 family peptidase n=1 Tax=Psychroserpens sp. TaxID=2020870 RepID=UPI001B179B7C|nr:C40 family peptidase [Psychroserpens sp.]MBO6607098.1 C40 family peptidase [Psychroserpens sp.]MBO6631277.1 C40 family peptidase [Psychroserpens sp.]MBO6654244.1 C40 family peptidase [Psychroserpens sp.]MBO6682470.1 C40 family peptidase [Psychroserpens sp.]MBO6750870.1 C40 family peptidase [Psychroserpens sp.]